MSGINNPLKASTLEFWSLEKPGEDKTGKRGAVCVWERGRERRVATRSWGWQVEGEM